MITDFMLGLLLGSIAMGIILVAILPEHLDEKPQEFQVNCDRYLNSTVVCYEFKYEGIFDFYPDKIEVARNDT